MTRFRRLALVVLLAFLWAGPLAPLADAAQKSIRSANQLSQTPGSADTLLVGGGKINDHGHEFDEAFLTNRAAGSTADGDVLAIDSANDSSAALDDTVGSLKKFVVAVDVIANAAQGKFARSGLVNAKAQGSIARFQYVRKSATTRAIEDAGVAVGATTNPPKGALGIALAAASGGFCTIYLFDQPIGDSLETGTWSADLGPSGTAARALDIVYQNTSGKKRRVAVWINIANADTTAGIEIDDVNPPTELFGQVGQDGASGAAMKHFVTFEVPSNWYYNVITGSGTPVIVRWRELDE